jgi:hypothetical protein
MGTSFPQFPPQPRNQSIPDKLSVQSRYAPHPANSNTIFKFFFIIEKVPPEPIFRHVTTPRDMSTSVVVRKFSIFGRACPLPSAA